MDDSLTIEDNSLFQYHGVTKAIPARWLGVEEKT